MDIFAGLNDKQKEVVEYIKGPLLVIAGAGAGKTKALTHRIAHLIQQGVNPRNILAVTFTNKAAGEMKERIAHLLNLDEVPKSTYYSYNFPVLGTFHSICVQILRENIEHIGYSKSFTIYDSLDQQTLIKRIIKEHNLDPKKFHHKAVLANISNAKNELIDFNEYKRISGNYFQENVAQIYQAYQLELQKSQALDFDDLIMKTVELLYSKPEILERLQERFQYISVDEYQDTNKCQYVLVKLLAEKYKNICVIGDSDQSIYSWRGADIRNILSFEKDYTNTKVIKLEQNYRSTQNILNAANNIIKKNSKRRDKKLWTSNNEGAKINILKCNNEYQEAEKIALALRNLLDEDIQNTYKSFCVLYRTNAQSRSIEEAFLRYGVPYKIIGGVKFYSRKEIKDVLAYLKLIGNPHDSVSLFRIINTPARKIGAKTLELLTQAAKENSISVFEVLLNAHEYLHMPASKIKALSGFRDLIVDLQVHAKKLVPSELIKYLLRQSGYQQFLLSENSVEGESRFENIQELISVSAKYNEFEPEEALTVFLEEISLIADTDNLNSSDETATLMTIHSAKGLEFDYVFVAGLEDGMFPHSQSLFDLDQLEEERRLMYVAVTRARKKLFLLFAKQRMIFGEYKMNSPSQFIFDIPQEYVLTNFVNEVVNMQAAQQSNYQTNRYKTDAFNSYKQDEAEVNKEVPNFNDGDKVLHKIFGAGIVVNTVGNVITIAFDTPKVGIKKFALSVAPLQKV